MAERAHRSRVAKAAKQPAAQPQGEEARAAQVRAQAKAAVSWARLHPVEWCRQFLRVEPDAWQAELMEAVADCWRKRKKVPTVVNHDAHNLITVRAMHGPGKTFGVGLLMHWFGHCWQTLSPCTAPKQKQLTTRLWPAFRKAMRNAVPGYSGMVEVDQQKITWHGDKDWAFVAETAATPENLAGYHDEFMLIVVEEASGVPEEMFPALEGALSTGKLVVMVLIGNPTKNIGTFHDSHMREVVAKHFYKIHVSLEKTTRVSRDWVKRMIEKYGEQSPVVQVRCFGNFATMDELQLIALQWIVDAWGRELVPDGSHPRTRLSVDVADGGADASVITLCDHYQSFVHARRQWQHWFESSRSPILLGQEVVRLWQELKLDARRGDDVVIDAIGVGAGTAGHVMMAKDAKGNDLNIPVVAYKGGETEGVNTAMYRCRRVQSHLAMRNDFRDGRIVIDEDFCGGSEEERAEFEAQTCSVRTRPGVEKVEDLETKDQMRADGIKSPDRTESLAMQWATQSPGLAARAAPTALVAGRLLTAHSEAARADW